MNDYISRETVRELFCESCGGGCENTEKCEWRDGVVDAIPAADVRPVVRCRDCKYNTGTKKCLHPDSIIRVPADDDFCSYGAADMRGKK